MAAKMSKRMEDALDYIRNRVESARTKTYEEWRGDLEDHAVMRMVYNENREGIVIGCDIDKRTLSALQKRGYIRYWDDMNCDTTCWCVKLVEE